MDRVADVKKQGAKYIIVMVSGETCRLPAPLVWHERVERDQPFDREEYFARNAKKAFTLALERAVYLLGKKDYTEKMMGNKLQEVGYPAGIADAVVAYLVSRKFLDDARYAQTYLERRKTRDGALKLKFSMARKGLSSETVESALQSLDEEEQIRAAKEHAVRYIRNRRGRMDEKKLFQNALASLMRKGYLFKAAKKSVTEALALLSEEDCE